MKKNSPFSTIHSQLPSRIILPYAKPLASLRDIKIESGAQVRRSGAQSPTQSSDPVIRLLRVLTDHALSSGELRTVLNLKHRPTFRDNYLHPAIEQKYIEMTLPDKPNSRLQKYRLTDKGREVLKKFGGDD